MDQNNNFNTQGYNSFTNNQPNTNMNNNFNQPPINNQPPKKKTNIGLIAGIIVGVIAVGVGSIMLLSNKDNNVSNTDSHNTDNTPNTQYEEKIGTSTWGLTLNGKNVNFPCLLNDLTKVGVSLTSEEYYEKVMNNPNSEFVVIFAGSENWKDEIYLSLRTKDDVSKKEKNVVVTNFQVETPKTMSGKILTDNMLTNEQFHLKGNISLGSTRDEVISTFGDDYVIESEIAPYFKICYEDEESELHLSFTNNELRTIQIWKKQ